MEVAGNGMGTVTMRRETGTDFPALLHGTGTARVKSAPRRKRRGAGGLARQGPSRWSFPGARARHGIEQASCVGVRGHVEEPVARSDFDEASRVHDRHAIRDMLERGPTLSFEFFPPRTLAAEQRLRETIDTLEKIEPDFVSVTYGAGGSTRETTRDTVIEMCAEIGRAHV